MLCCSLSCWGVSSVSAKETPGPLFRILYASGMLLPSCLSHTSRYVETDLLESRARGQLQSIPFPFYTFKRKKNLFLQFKNFSACRSVGLVLPRCPYGGTAAFRPPVLGPRVCSEAATFVHGGHDEQLAFSRHLRAHCQSPTVLWDDS